MTVKKETKKKKMTVNTLNDNVKVIERDMEHFENSVKSLKRKLTLIELNLKFITDKQTSEIKVLEDDGKWGGYTGVFYLNTKDNKKTVTNKALGHYGRYFEDKDFYKNKTLGLFITSPKGKKLVKILQDPEKKLEDTHRLHADTLYTLKHIK